MKKLIFGFSIALAAIILMPTTSQAQVVVKIRPPRPKVVVVKPAKVKRNHVWVDGHWKWSKRKHKYVWVKGHWIRQKRGHVWVPGHWNKVPGGHKWIPGHWR